MTRLNKYYNRSHISEKKFRLLIKYFAMDLTASRTALLTGISRRSVNSIFQKIRQRLARECETASPIRN